jgi:hypothetical protein
MNLNNSLKYICNTIVTLSFGQFKTSKWIFAVTLLTALSFTMPSCKVKEGCPVKDYTNNMEKTSKRGKSNLFDKSTRKKMKK